MQILRIYNKDFSPLTTLTQEDFVNLGYKRTLGEIGDCQFRVRLDRPKITNANLQKYNRIEIVEDGVVRFIGVIITTSVRLNTADVRCKELTYVLKRRILGENYVVSGLVAEKAVQLLTDINAIDDTGIDIGDASGAIGTVNATYNHTNAFEILRQITDPTGNQFRLEADRTIKISTDVGEDLSDVLILQYSTDLPSASNILSFNVQADGDEIVTGVRGQSQSLTSSQEDAVLKAKYGLLEEYEDFRVINDQPTLDEYSLAKIADEKFSPSISLSPDVEHGEITISKKARSTERQKKITVDHTKVGADMTDYVLFLDLSHMGDDFFSRVRSDGRDIRVYAEEGNQLPFELVNINVSTKTGRLFFKGSISASVDTSFYIRYGNPSNTALPANSTYGKYAVWSDYVDVYHLATNGNDSAVAQKNINQVVYATQEDGYMDFKGEEVIVDMLNGTTAHPFGRATGQQRIAQSFVLTETLLANLDAMFRKMANVGSPTDAVKFAIQADVAGNPSGTDLLSSTLNWNGTGQPAVNTDFLMYSVVGTSLVLGNTYWVVLSRNGALSDAAYPNAAYDPAGTSGVFKYYDGASWITVTGSLRMRLFKSGYARFSSAINGIPVQDIAISFALKKSDTAYESIFANASLSNTGHLEINGSSGPALQNGRITYRPSSGTQRSLDTGINVADGQEHWYDYVRDAVSSRIYVDGVLLASGTTDADGSTSFNYIGIIQGRINSTYGQALKGQLRNVKFGKAAKISAGRVLTQFNNQSSPASFYVVGEESEIPEYFVDGYYFKGKKTIVIDPSKVGTGGVTDFPVLVNLADLGSEFFNNLKTNGSDMRIVDDATGDLVAHELVNFDNVTKSGQLFFRAPALSSLDITTFHIYHGNTDATSYAANHPLYGSQKVWEDYAGVWHLGDVGEIKKDSTGNSDGLVDRVVSIIDGKTGKAVRFSSTTPGEIFIPDPAGKTNFDTPESYTISFWAKRWINTVLSDRSISEHWEAAGGINPYPFSFRGFTGSTNISFNIYNGGSGAPSGLVGNPGVNVDVALPAEDTWTLYKFKKDRSARLLRSFTNGIARKTSVDNVPDGDSTKSAVNGFVIGERTSAGTTRTPNLDIQHFFIKKGLTSAAFDITEYNNQNSPSTFYSVSNSEPSNQEATIITTTTEAVTFDVGDTVRVIFKNALIDIDDTFQVLEKTVQYQGDQKSISVRINDLPKELADILSERDRRLELLEKQL